MRNYIISVSLGTGCYRHIELSDRATLEQLSDAIVSAFNFDNDHAHAFFMDDKYWGHGEPYWSAAASLPGKTTRSMKLWKLGLEKGSKFKYIFDFGDEWRFQCRLLRIEETDTPAIAHVIRSVGDASEQYPRYEEDDEYDEYDEDDELFDFIGEEADEDDEADGEWDDIEDDLTDGELLELCAELRLPDETVLELYKFFLAASNVYGIIPLKKLYDIYISLFQPLSYTKFLSFAAIMRCCTPMFTLFAPYEWEEIETEQDFCSRRYIDEWELASEGVVEEDLYKTIKTAQADKPYKSFRREELMVFADEYRELYIPAGQDMLRFAGEHLRLSENQMKALTGLFVLCLRDNGPVEALFELLDVCGIKITKKRDKNTIREMFALWSPKVSKPSNRGYSDEELIAMGLMEKPKKNEQQSLFDAD